MAQRAAPPVVHDEYIRLAEGVTPYRYLERIAIAHIEGGLSLTEAHRLAAFELANEDHWRRT